MMQNISVLMSPRSPSGFTDIKKPIDHEIVFTFILRPLADSFEKDFCQLQAKVCERITG